jgi:phosphonate transport system substrate-binding protein
MKKIFFTGLIILLLLGACAAPATPTPQPPTVEETESPPELVIVIGDITDDPAEVIEGAQPLADYLAEKLSDYGVTAGKVRVVSSMEEMAQLLKNGEVDIYFDSIYPATYISDLSGAQIVLRRWRFGVEEYHSVIFASKTSGITSVQDLTGQIMVMDAPYSTSGYMLPAVHLLEAGLTLTAKSSYDDPVATNEVGFVFSYDDENTLQWVLSGRAEAGVVDDYRYDVAFPAEVTANDLVVLARTDGVPRQVMVVRPGMDPALLEALKQVLINMDEDQAAAAALKKFQTTQFDEFPEGISVAMNEIRTMFEMVRALALP